VNLAFDLDVYAERQQRVLDRMRDQGMDALVVNLPDNLYYLTGNDSIGYIWRQALILSPALEEPIFVTRSVEEPVVWQTSTVRRAVFYDIITTDPIQVEADLLRQHDLEKGRIGLELQAFTFLPAQYERLTAALPEVDFVDASELVAEERVIKSPQEVAYQRQAGQMADYAMAVVMEALRPGMTEAQLAGIASKALGDAGSELSAIPPLVQTGRRTTMGHALPMNVPIAVGDLVAIEFAGVCRRYHAPILRSAFVGRPPDRLEEDFACLKEAVVAATQAARAGTPVTEPDRATNAVLARRGLDKRRMHRLGYSIGIAYAPTWLEPMVLAEPDTHTLVPNMSFTIEPNLMNLDEGWGFKLGNTVLCTEDGGVPLTTFPLDLHVVA
jgi:Xaa-Pro aminopeptidase